MLLLGTPLASQADQIAPNPNPVGDTITVSGSDENAIFFTNNGNLGITSTGALSNADRLESYGSLSIDAGGALTNADNWGQVWNYGTLTNAGSLVNGSGATLNNESGGTLENTDTLSNSGTINSYDAFTNSGTIHNYTGGEIYNYGGSAFTNTGTLINDDWFQSNTTLNNSGTITSSGWLANSGAWNNTGSVESSGLVYNYSGGTWTNSATGSLTNSGSFYDWGNFINNGALTNSGTFQIGWGGTSTNNSTITNTGTFQVGAGGAFTNNGEVNTSDTFTNVGTLTNNGTLTNSGTFTNTGTFSGTGTFVNDGGTIDDSGAMSIATLVVNSGSTGTVTGTAATSVTTANVGGTLDYTGSGSLSVTSLNLADGTLTSSGTGGVDIGTATVAAGDTGLINGSGNVELATADVDGTLTISSTLSGAGSLTKTGAGLLRLTGANTYTGATSVDEGTLAVDGSVTSDVTVDTDATLMGVGTVFGDVVNNGTIAPGNSIGSLTVNGDYTQNAGSTYEVEVNAAGQSDTLTVTGTATLNGGTVSVLADTGAYSVATDYTILTATGGITGTFADVTSNLAFLTPSLSYDANNAFLNLTRNSTTFADVAASGNQYAVASALDRGYSSAGGDMTTVYNSLLGLSAAGARSAYDQMGGLTHAALSDVTSFAFDNYVSILSSRMGERSMGSLSNGQPLLAFLSNTVSDAAPLAAPGRNLWMTGYGSRGNRSGGDTASRYDYDAGGMAMGYDQKLGRDFLLGGSAGYTATTVDMSGLNDDADVDLWQVSLYGSYAPGPWYVNGIAAYGYSRYDSSRRIAFGGLHRKADAEYGSHIVLGQVESGYTLEAGEARLTPFAALQAASMLREAFNESGAGALNLAVSEEQSQSLESSLGLALEQTFQTARGDLTPKARLAWRHQMWDTDHELSGSFVGDPAAAFTVRTEDAGRDSAVGGLGLTWAVRENLALAADYEATLGQDQVRQLGSLLLRYSW